MPRTTDDWTVDGLAQLPDDGLRYERVDGMLLVSPSPRPRHQRAVARLLRILYDACPPDLEVFPGPLDWVPDRRSALEPDLLVVAKANIGEDNITTPLTLAVEVLSSSSRLRDTTLEHARYAEGGVASYWIVDPDGPSIVVYRLEGTAYVEAARGSGDESVTVDLPYPVTVVPSELVET